MALTERMDLALASPDRRASRSALTVFPRFFAAASWESPSNAVSSNGSFQPATRDGVVQATELGVHLCRQVSSDFQKKAPSLATFRRNCLAAGCSICFSPYLYRARNLIERFFNKIKHCRRVATRYDKLAANYLAFVELASIRLWPRVYEFTT